MLRGRTELSRTTPSLVSDSESPYAYTAESSLRFAHASNAPSCGCGTLIGRGNLSTTFIGSSSLDDTSSLDDDTEGGLADFFIVAATDAAPLRLRSAYAIATSEGFEGGNNGIFSALFICRARACARAASTCLRYFGVSTLSIHGSPPVTVDGHLLAIVINAKPRIATDNPTLTSDDAFSNHRTSAFL